MDIKKSQNKPKGFTLIELLITVTVLGILVALAAPSMFSILEGRKLKGAAENLVVDLMLAKTESIKRNNEVILSFGGVSPAWCYGLKEEVSCDCTVVNDCSIDGIERIATSEPYGNTTLTPVFPADSPEETGFEPLRGFSRDSGGSPSNGTATFSNDGRNVLVKVSSLGRVRVCSDTNFGGYNAC